MRLDRSLKFLSERVANVFDESGFYFWLKVTRFSNLTAQTKESLVFAKCDPDKEWHAVVVADFMKADRFGAFIEATGPTLRRRRA